MEHWQGDSHWTLSSCKYHLLHDHPKSLRHSEPATIAEKRHFTKAQSVVVAKFLRFVMDFDLTSGDAATIKAVEKWERFANVTR